MLAQLSKNLGNLIQKLFDNKGAIVIAYALLFALQKV